MVKIVQHLLRILTGRVVAPVPVCARRIRTALSLTMLAMLTTAIAACWNARDLPPRTNMGQGAITSNRPLPPPADDGSGGPGDDGSTNDNYAP